MRPLAGEIVATRLTAPEKPLIAVTEMVDAPAVPPLVMIIVKGLADSEKSWMVTLTLVVCDNVFGAVPVVPATSTLNGATPVVQLTERTAPLNAAAQPVGTVPAMKATVPVNPLIGVRATVDVPVTVARVVIAGADKLKS